MPRPSWLLSLRLIPAVLALAAPLPLNAVQPEAPLARIQHAAGGESLTFRGQNIHHAPGRINNLRQHTFPDSPVVMITWQESGQRAGGTSHFAISTDGQRIDQIALTGNKIRLRYATFDPLVEQPIIPDVLRAGAAPDNELFLVQFVGTPLEEMRARIRALGGTVERFLTDNTHIVRIAPRHRANIEALPFVRWVGPFHPAYRLDEPAREHILAHASQPGRADPAIRYNIECLRAGLEQQQLVADFITAIGGVVDYTGLINRRMEATLTGAQLLAVARRNEIAFIDVWGPPSTTMDIARQIGGAVPIVADAGFTGRGVRVEVIDSGIQMNHPEWAGQPPILHGPAIGNATVHGTNVYGIILSTGTVDPQSTGLLPQREQGIFAHFDYLLQTGFDRVAFTLQSVDPAGPYRVVVQNNSWGSIPPTTAYTTISAELDDAIFRSNLLVSQSQGNEATYSRAQGWAKNTVSVGGLFHQNTLDRFDDLYETNWAGGPSTGPAADGRTKPDLVHFYDNIFTTSPGGGYTPSFGGTSGASPITAGHFGLLFQMWHEETFGGWGGDHTVFDSRPHYALAKAIAFATAFRYQWIDPPHSSWSTITRHVQGWGMIDIGRIYTLRDRSFFVNGDIPLANAQTIAFPITVANGESELLISMVFSDPPGNPAAAQARINNLDLRAISPTGAVYWGNHGLLNSNWSLPGGGPNTVDTAENIFIQSPEPGEWTLEVIGTQIVENTVPNLPPGEIMANFGLAVFGGTGPAHDPVRIRFPEGLPTLLAPNQPHEITVTITAGTQAIEPGSPTLHFRPSPGSAWQSLPLAHIGGDEYRAALPALPCGSLPQIYFSAQGDLGAQVTLPRLAPDRTFDTRIATVLALPLLETDFQGTSFPSGWISTGYWAVTNACAPAGTPCAPGPYAYYGRTVTCAYNSPTGRNSGILTAPEITIPPISPEGNLQLTFCYALETENRPAYDKAELFINGQTRPEWRLPDVRPTPSDPDRRWATAEFDLTEFGGQNISISWRFDTMDHNNNAFRGWHLTNIRLIATTATCPELCYANCDGSTVEPVLNVDDFTCFINAFAAAQSLPHAEQITHYANCDGSAIAPVLNVDDFTCFINAFAQGCP